MDKFSLNRMNIGLLAFALRNFEKIFCPNSAYSRIQKVVNVVNVVKVLVIFRA